ncbi:FAD-dependent oxidoreductase [Bordetella hinzii]|uniref:Pyridine nucleotide-disulfide oxidoreductase n=1 Tax=Bordetella hinzii OH87 BAL007II TaxID=1331262 RepID=A0ABR4R5U1_9BORD|nr:FAD/NAD(P)-binding oxidoreductase [Bordetella hinzii]KCB25945.1 pyridine nucleotide-disulfide oxidoreductase [Bordetella hinzii OH87 BAL007II]KCB33324.1 pyridine nucleotide-disulfide oxidoreductase [Bordetella hinzii CA90 BAL1384]KCB41337.1 pyridine nucleotide-disulfide oxidoreductase [Bordetella hinzii 5132]QDJ40545.1 NAD(P)/FAD-dependent oxidoreductase [Bordetella hinzii]QDJ45105.1 NAD(P)/FAD-dependent oxidoreductase [Bordetella hinzii]
MKTVAVVGAGPAGVRCAQALVRAGLRPVVIDEGLRDGGQIYRRQPEGFKRGYAALYGTEASRAQALHQTFDALRGAIQYESETLVWNASPGRLHLLHAGHSRDLAFDAAVICSGATDRLMPVTGWHRAGCYSLGGAQIALKSQACAIGEKVVFMGTGPLLYLVAAQYRKAGAQVAAVVDTSRRADLWRGLPGMLARPDVLKKGLALMGALRGVPVYQGAQVLEVLGEDAGGVNGLLLREASGATRELRCDAVAMGYHLRAETQLADLLRCPFRFDEASRQWLPRIDPWGRASVAGVYLAGDGVRLQGADGAEASGELAALAVLKDLGREIDEGRARALLRVLARMERFRQGIARAFPWPHASAASLPDRAVVCRCEGISAGELRRVVSEEGAREANRAKAFSRVGMGRCQGRYCGHAGAEIVAAAAAVDIRDVGRLRTQAPVKPLPAMTRQAQP